MLLVENVIESDVYYGCGCVFKVGEDWKMEEERGGEIPEHDLTFPTPGGGSQSRRC